MDCVSLSTNSFAIDLYKEIVKGRSDSNILISPVSLITALSMTYGGAAGETKEQMRSVLHYTDLKDDDIHKAIHSLQTYLYRDKKPYTLDGANKLFAQEEFPFKDEFLALTKEQYGSELEKVNFKTSFNEVRININNWVESMTKDRIKDLIGEGVLNRLTRLVLVNALYFKGDWVTQFDPKKTHQGKFITETKGEVDAMFMYMKDKFNVFRSKEVYALEMPYKGDDLSMVFILPHRGISDIEAKLNSKWLAEVFQGFRKIELGVRIPKFRLEDSFSLKDTLSAMGMPHLFSEELCDLSGVTGARDLVVGAVLHKTFVLVNEEGSEAAAATAVVMMMLSAMGPPPFELTRPFLFAIRDKKNDILLFLGKVTNPNPGLHK